MWGKLLLIICILIHFQVCHGTLTAVDDHRTQFSQLQVKMEFTITTIRYLVHDELNKLDPVIAHLHHKLEPKAHNIRALAIRRRIEAKTNKTSISHCLRSLKILSKNLDLYNLEKCKTVPCSVEDTFVEAKKLSLSMFRTRTHCESLYESDSPRKAQQCFREAFDEADKEHKRISRKLRVVGDNVFTNGLMCLQNSFNSVIKEICLLSCQFEICVAMKCRGGHSRSGFGGVI